MIKKFINFIKGNGKIAGIAWIFVLLACLYGLAWGLTYIISLINISIILIFLHKNALLLFIFLAIAVFLFLVTIFKMITDGIKK
jgi:hypothetical protein